MSSITYVLPAIGNAPMHLYLVDTDRIYQSIEDISWAHI